MWATHTMQASWRRILQNTLAKSCRFASGGNVCLLGPPGAGKTTIGAALATNLQKHVVDVDNDVLETIWGTSVADKLKQVGDVQFLKEEGQAVKNIDIENTVLSLSGSNPMDPEGMAHIRKLGRVVYLDAPDEDILRRMHRMKVNRIVGQDTKSLADILKYRRSIYDTCYDTRVLIEPGASVSEVTQAVLGELSRDRRLVSTRGGESVSFATALQQGIASDGGLYVPCELPRFSTAQLVRMVPLSYQDRALRVLERFGIAPLTPPKLREAIAAAYSSFNTPEVLPVLHLENNHYLLEQWHGPTASFKDLALQLTPRLLSAAAGKSDVKQTLLVATSGDTGSAALHGFAQANMSVIVLYPLGGVSDIQQAQMLTAKGHVCVLGVRDSDFDFCQSTVKRLFADSEFQKAVQAQNRSLTSGNSINWGRLLPQIAYTFSGYLDLARKGVLRVGDPMDVCIPSGNFGQAVAALYAKKMGLPLRHILVASNENCILHDVLTTGVFDIRKRTLQQTISPSIDILSPSNFERAVHLISSEDAPLVRSLFADRLPRDKMFTLSRRHRHALEENFKAGVCTQDECVQVMRDVFTRTGYLLDPHTAVGKHVADRLGDKHVPTLLASTAHYGKFTGAAKRAVGDAQVQQPAPHAELLRAAQGQLPNAETIAADYETIKTCILSFLR
eukprot:TRINITY_DN10654_c0_g1_i1.p1 TRINITY_DN10654_c0_g1~~TRINITY_DN10654_c0_g1_i1.p1  ORF type:complete len:674 (+),score=139.82 TRINITY_DN10654_c0_g1_i1:16-2037(+)